MQLSRAALIALLREALTDPQASARRMIALNLGPQALRLGLLLAAVLSVLVLYFGLGVAHLLSGGQRGGVAGMPAPIPMVVIQVAIMAVTAGAVHYIGRQFGGKGAFDQALTVVVWLQVVLIALQLVQLVVMLVVPPLGDLLSIVAVGLFFWMLTGFVAEVHGFRSRGRVFASILASFFALSLVLAVVLSILLGSPQGGM